MNKLATILSVLALLLPASPSFAAGDDSLPPGWAGADLATAQAMAAGSRRSVLIFTRKQNCIPCDRVERWLTADQQITPLTEPYIRLRLSLDEASGQVAATLLKIPTAPTVLILGPDGMEATRQAGDISRSWLVEKLQIAVRRHQPDSDHEPPTAAALAASLERLLDWGDLQGAEQVRRRLDLTGTTVHPAHNSVLVPETNLEIDTLSDLADRLALVEDPSEFRNEAHEIALALEREGRAGMSLAAYRLAVDRLTVAPLSQARAAFLAERQNLPLEVHLQRLAEERAARPDSVSVLMAQARLAETLGRIFMAYHAVEAAMVYAPDDAWVNLEHRRLRLLVRLRSRGMERDPT
jgi:hypothetical protein